MKLARITWDPKYSVHVAAIDAQHERLFEITNELLDAWESGSDEAFPVLEALVDYLSVHFHTEHMAMKEAHYPGFLAHTREHDAFNERIGEFIRNYRAESKTLMSEMIVFLRDWVFTHTCVLDQGYGKYIQKKGAGLR